MLVALTYANWVATCKLEMSEGEVSVGGEGGGLLYLLNW